MTDRVTTPDDLLSRGEDALPADWAAARRLFSEALERRETHEALEGLGTAAAELALDVRERAYAR